MATAQTENEVIASEYGDDQGRCFYCGDKSFKSPRKWWRHLQDEHPATTRVLTVKEALKKAGV